MSSWLVPNLVSSCEVCPRSADAECIIESMRSAGNCDSTMLVVLPAAMSRASCAQPVMTADMSSSTIAWASWACLCLVVNSTLSEGLTRERERMFCSAAKECWHPGSLSGRTFAVKSLLVAISPPAKALGDELTEDGPIDASAATASRALPAIGIKTTLSKVVCSHWLCIATHALSPSYNPAG